MSKCIVLLFACIAVCTVPVSASIHPSGSGIAAPSSGKRRAIQYSIGSDERAHVMVRLGDTLWFQSTGTSNKCGHPGAFFVTHGLWDNVFRIDTSERKEVRNFCERSLEEMQVVKDRTIPFDMTADKMKFLLEWDPTVPDDGLRGKNNRRAMMFVGSRPTADHIARSWQMSKFKEADCGGVEVCDFVYLYRFETLEQLIVSNTLRNSLGTLTCKRLKELLANDINVSASVKVDTVPKIKNRSQEKAFFIDHFMNIPYKAQLQLKEMCGLQHEKPIPLPSSPTIS